MRVTIADNDVLFGWSFLLLLKELGIEVIAQASDGDEVVQAVGNDTPDVVIIDIFMPPSASDGLGGLTAAENIRSEHPDVGVLLLSCYASTEYAQRLLDCLGAGGKGYLIKERVRDLDTLRDVLEAVASGGVRIDPEIVKRLVSRRRNAVESLTPQQRAVLEFVAQGLSNNAIANRLSIASRTADRHVQDIFERLEIQNDGSTNRRTLAALKYFEAIHVCDQRCARGCAVSTFHLVSPPRSPSN